MFHICYIWLVYVVYIFGKSHNKVEAVNYVGGCSSQPKTPENGNLRCTIKTGCIVTCNSRHQFPGGATRLGIRCSEGEWVAFGKSWKDNYMSCERVGAGITNNDEDQVKLKSGTCYAWGKAHFKTFDGKIFSLSSDCSHVLVEDAVDNTFRVSIQNSLKCPKFLPNCYKIIKLYHLGKNYVLAISDDGLPIFQSGAMNRQIPVNLPGLTVEISGQYVIVDLNGIGLKIKWDMRHFIQVDANENLWEQTGGLCGKIDGNEANDLTAKDGSLLSNIVDFAVSWQVDACHKVPSTVSACVGNARKGSYGQDFCRKTLKDAKFVDCQSSTDLTSQLLNTCAWDYCSCHLKDPRGCACDTINVYARECIRMGVTSVTQWRNDQLCPINCSGGRVFMACAPKGRRFCGQNDQSSTDGEVCEEGCYCPTGTVLHEAKCIVEHNCPCSLDGKDHSNGAIVKQDCNTCECRGGKWECTQKFCGGICSAVGDPHYSTFDGKKYDFMGSCSYYLLRTDELDIIGENAAWAGKYVPTAPGLPTCTKRVIIKTGDHVIKLEQGQIVTVDDETLNSLPYTIHKIQIRRLSSLFVSVLLPNGVEVKWDGLFKVYVAVPSSFKGKTKGLCGTYNGQPNDDFATPDGTIETSATNFGNKWKTEDSCVPTAIPIDPKHPCDVYGNRRQVAEAFCSKLKSGIFSDCHRLVDPESAYQDCLYDTCSCEGDQTKCLCPMLAVYGDECRAHGVTINWRESVVECGVQCQGGQRYQVCANPCRRTCEDISEANDCTQKCVEGCACDELEALDDNDVCVPIKSCGCSLNGNLYPAGHQLIRDERKLCTCTAATWSCRPATREDVNENPKDEYPTCSDDTLEYTTCKSLQPLTCTNMHQYTSFDVGECEAGCECKEGLVLNLDTNRCVQPFECPCHHGSRSYDENDVVQHDCNTCTCKGGEWKCTDNQCLAECHVWGDSHFKTFDGNRYDFQGKCSYIMAIGWMSLEQYFRVSMQIASCSTLEVSCLKSIYIDVRYGGESDSVRLVRHKRMPLRKKYNLVSMRDLGQFIVVEGDSLGFALHWDKGTRVYIKVNSQWRNKISGLCGNYNGDPSDDFTTQGTGVVADSAILFGNSWMAGHYCPDTKEITNTCDLRPERRTWSIKQCEFLKAEVFQPCHSKVPVDFYYEKCVFDSCACDEGGDCECLCTAIAAYAQECNNIGVPIKWRRMDFCPLQCDEAKSLYYNPCVSTCPNEHCDTITSPDQSEQFCKGVSCVEGCAPKLCPPGQVYFNTSLSQCVSRNTCKSICLQVGDVVYREGDVMEQDRCHTCHCFNGRRACNGEPCDETTVTTTKPNNCEGRVSGESWQKDACTYCSCHGGSMTCDTTRCSSKANCQHGGKVYREGEIMEHDACHICICSNGRQTCSGQPCVTTSATTTPNNCDGHDSGETWQKDACTYCSCISGSITCDKTRCSSIRTCEQNGVSYGEGDVMEQDACHICRCSRGMQVCDGHPCSKITTTEKSNNCDGHFSGESWQKDKCTYCFCQTGSIICHETSCPSIDTVCSNGYTPVKILINDDECCDRYTCVPQCRVPVKISCRQSYVMAKIRDSAGCEKYVCKCKECKPIDYSIKLPPGQFRLVKHDECCLYEDLICKPELCPGPTRCQPYERVESVNIEEQCCPTYKCVIQDGCIVNRTIGNVKKYEVMKVGETWNNGPCVHCTCSRDTIDGYRSDCMAKKCPIFHMDPQNFVYKDESSPNDCCPKMKPIACKYHGIEYIEGESWNVDKCRKESCDRSNDGYLIKSKRFMNCNTNCEEGYRFEESIDLCCGRCVQYACVFDQGIRHVGQTWKSYDTCVTNTCEKIGDQFIVVSQHESCPSLTDCPPHRIYRRGCCKHCRLQEQAQTSACQLVEVDPRRTLQLITVAMNEITTCTNLKPVVGYKECVGGCLNPDKANCCHPSKVETTKTELSCNDGSTITKEVRIPTACSCTDC